MTVDPNILLDGTAATTNQHNHKKNLLGRTMPRVNLPLKSTSAGSREVTLGPWGAPPGGCTILNPKVAVTVMCDHGGRTECQLGALTRLPVTTLSACPLPGAYRSML